MNVPEENPTTVSPEEAKSEPTAGDAAADIAQLQAELGKYKDLAMRTAADLDNFRKRAAREREDSIRYANISLLERLLPVVDSFELGLEAAQKASDAGGILQGMSMIKKQLEDFLKDSGVTPINAVGSPFDHNLHEAVGQEASAEIAEGNVLRQLRKGYQLKDRLLRASTVIVSKGKATE